MAGSIHQMADRISALLVQKYRVKGRLSDQAPRLRRRLPGRVNDALALMISAEYMAQNPALLPQIDHEAVAAAYDLALKHLNGIDTSDRRKGAVVGIAASIAFSLLVVALGLLAVLHWRGYL